MKMPKRIRPCPIIEAIVEIRFAKTEMPFDAFLGLIYPKVKPFFSSYESLPIMRIPQEVLAHQPELAYQPHQRLISERFMLQIGPGVIALNNFNEYVGWTDFSAIIREHFSIIVELGLIQEFERLALRYIDFFALNVFEHIELEARMRQHPLQGQELLVRSVQDCGKYLCNMQISNRASFSANQGPTLEGSMIDIDTVYKNASALVPGDSEGLFAAIEGAHNAEKALFYSLLKPEFLENLNPEYD